MQHLPRHQVTTREEIRDQSVSTLVVPCCATWLPVGGGGGHTHPHSPSRITADKRRGARPKCPPSTHRALPYLAPRTRLPPDPRPPGIAADTHDKSLASTNTSPPPRRALRGGGPRAADGDRRFVRAPERHTCAKQRRDSRQRRLQCNTLMRGAGHWQAE